MIRILAARIIIFALACVWIVGFLMAGLAIFEHYSVFVEEYFGTGFYYNFLSGWYIVSVVLIAVLTANRGFRFVGHWVRKDAKSS